MNLWKWVFNLFFMSNGLQWICESGALACCFTSVVSWLLLHAYCFMSVSHLLNHVCCFTPVISCLLFHACCFMSVVSWQLFYACCFMSVVHVIICRRSGLGWMESLPPGSICWWPWLTWTSFSSELFTQGRLRRLRKFITVIVCCVRLVNVIVCCVSLVNVFVCCIVVFMW